MYLYALYEMLGVKLGAVCVLDKHSTNCTISPGNNHIEPYEIPHWKKKKAPQTLQVDRFAEKAAETDV